MMGEAKAEYCPGAGSNLDRKFRSNQSLGGVGLLELPENLPRRFGAGAIRVGHAWYAVIVTASQNGSAFDVVIITAYHEPGSRTKPAVVRPEPRD